MKRDIKLLKDIFPELKDYNDEEILKMFDSPMNKNNAYINGPAIKVSNDYNKDYDYAMLHNVINAARENNKKLKVW